jgi:hypothetical protein
MSDIIKRTTALQVDSEAIFPAPQFGSRIAKVVWEWWRAGFECSFHGAILENKVAPVLSYHSSRLLKVIPYTYEPESLKANVNLVRLCQLASIEGNRQEERRAQACPIDSRCNSGVHRRTDERFRRSQDGYDEPSISRSK